MRRHYSLVLMAVWLSAAAVLLAPDLLPDKLRGQVRGVGGSMAGALALVFAAYNLVRWWAAGKVAASRPRPNPLAPRRRDEEPYKPNPELDFLRVPDAEKKD
ncbi:hypothetical protein J0H58_10765 [bacterium]|nr:hypothetical protein [bacterium]